MDKDRRIRELEAQIQVLTRDNQLLAEDGENSLLLGLISEHIYQARDAAVLLDWVLERISLLKNIVYCAAGTIHGRQLRVEHFFHGSSNAAMGGQMVELPEEAHAAILAEQDEPTSRTHRLLVELPLAEQTCSLLALIPPGQSQVEHLLVFLFGSGNGPGSEDWRIMERQLTALERITEMVCARRENMLLLARLQELNSNLDQKVLERTRTLSRVNRQLREEILERRRIQEELAMEEKRLAATLGSIGDGVISTDLRGRIVLINHNAETLTGWSNQSAVGMELAKVLHLMDKRQVHGLADPVAAALAANGSQEIAEEALLISRQGGQRIVSVVSAPVHDRAEGLVGAVLVLRDVTEKSRMQAEVRKLQKLESIGVLAGGIAHDFNNILTAVVGNITLAKMDAEPDSKQYRMLKSAEKAALRAATLTQQLLTFSKGGAPVKEVSSMTSLLRDCAEFILQGSKVDCVYDFAPGVWHVEMDVGQISQVVENLLVNARQAMPAGGQLTITCRNYDNGQENNPLLGNGKYVEVRVLDEGVGIHPDLVDKVFDPYFTTKQQGSGLGLAVAHSIIRKHKGVIDVQSELGRGTEFSIYLPALEPAARPPGKERFAPAERSATGTIILMDDDANIRELISEVLVNAGFEVRATSCGEEAIAAFQELRRAGTAVDLLILDLTVPGGMGGEEAIRAVHGIDPQIRAVVISGYFSDPVMARCNDYGFCAALAKPFQVADLLRTVREQVARSQSR